MRWGRGARLLRGGDGGRGSAGGAGAGSGTLESDMGAGMASGGTLGRKAEVATGREGHIDGRGGERARRRMSATLA